MAAQDESWRMHLDELGPGTLIDTWRVVERLGSGGSGPSTRWSTWPSREPGTR